MVTIKLTELTLKVSNGETIEELMSFYNLSRTNIVSLLKEANLKVSKKPYRLIYDDKDTCSKKESTDYILIEEDQLFN